MQSSENVELQLKDKLKLGRVAKILNPIQTLPDELDVKAAGIGHDEFCGPYRVSRNHIQGA